MRAYLIILSLLFCSVAFAQNTVSGTVTDENNQPLPGASIKVAGESTGTTTDAEGKFTIKPKKQPPLTLEISSVGHTKQLITVTSYKQTINVQLLPEDINLDEIVVSASRTPEKVRESPVTIERMTIRDIKKTASPTLELRAPKK